MSAPEASEAWSGEGCCVSSPLDGAAFLDEQYGDDCYHGEPR
jgi:hypothetical protein